MRRMIVVLTGVMILSGLVLAGTFSGVTDRIEANRIAALNASLSAILPGDDLMFEVLDAEGPTVYRASETGEVAGYAVRVQARGYGGTITMLVGISRDLDEILGLEIVDQIETPGLGARILEHGFRNQFSGLDPDEPLSYVRHVQPNPEENEIQAITGATMTSRAVVVGINAALGQALQTMRRTDTEWQAL
jgi:Na+-translocating ferredoxin:NAD+ oxidoreductase subunit G